MSSVTQILRAAWRRLASLAYVDHRVADATHAASVAASRIETLMREQRLLGGPTVLYRRGDLEAFAGRLTAQGHRVAPFDFDTGSGPLDRYVDFPPYLDEPHLRLAIERYPSTSIGLIVEASSSA